MKTKDFKKWTDTGQFIPIAELTKDELQYVTMLPDTEEVIVYGGGYIIQANRKNIFSFNKEFMSMTLSEVEKFIWNNHLKKEYVNETGNI